MEQKQLGKNLPRFTWNQAAPHLPKFRWQKDRTPQSITPMVKGGHLGVIRMLEEINPVVERWNQLATASPKKMEKEINKEYGTEVKRIVRKYTKAPLDSLIKKIADAAIPQLYLIVGTASVVVLTAKGLPEKIVVGAYIGVMAALCALAYSSKLALEARKNAIYNRLVKEGVINPPEVRQ